MARSRQKSESRVTSGKNLYEDFIRKYGSVPFNQIDKMQVIKSVSATWEDRPKSNIVKWLIEKSGANLEDIASCLNCSELYLNSKLHRDAFTFDDMIVIAYVCGYSLAFEGNNPDGRQQSQFQVDVEEFFKSSDDNILERLHNYDTIRKQRKREEYDKLKAKLNQMREEYGFDD